jgi:hypothetical protein
MPVTLVTGEVKIGRILVQGQPRKKVIETSSQQKRWVWWCMPVPSYMTGIGRRITV